MNDDAKVDRLSASFGVGLARPDALSLPRHARRADEEIAGELEYVSPIKILLTPLGSAMSSSSVPAEAFARIRLGPRSTTRAISAVEWRVLSEHAAEWQLRHGGGAVTGSVGRLTKAMFFIFRYLCCRRVDFPRKVEPGPRASMWALRCRHGQARRGDKCGMDAVFALGAADGHGVCAVADPRFMIYGLPLVIYDPRLGSRAQMVNRKWQISSVEVVWV